MILYAQRRTDSFFKSLANVTRRLPRFHIYHARIACLMCLRASHNFPDKLFRLFYCDKYLSIAYTYTKLIRPWKSRERISFSLFIHFILFNLSIKSKCFVSEKGFIAHSINFLDIILSYFILLYALHICCVNEKI